MELYLHTLAKNILKLSASPIAKVRFAKIIYFVHKDLIINGLVASSQLAFIRMPLGPVADGFMSLDDDRDIVVTKDSVGLLYNREKYSLRLGANVDQIIDAQSIQDTLKKISKISTSDLIEISHNDPSWQKYANGSVYFISDLDLTQQFPATQIVSVSTINTDLENQIIQSQLIKGMIDDAVKDSTTIEHPLNRD